MLQIVGIDAINTKDYRQVENMIVSHLQSLRNTPQFKDSLFCFMPEMNLNHFETARVIDLVEDRFQPLYVVSHDSTGKKRLGVLTTDEEKRNYTFFVQRGLQERTLAWSKALIGANTERDKAALVDQINNWKEHIKQAKDAFGKTKITVGGKDGGAKKDDLFISFAIAGYIAHVTMASPAFLRFARQHRVILPA